MRINRFLARSGIASRRKCDEIIQSGLIKINNKTAELSDKVDICNDVVTFNGNVIKLPDEKEYYVINKPENIISAVSDDRGRKTVMDLIRLPKGFFPVGRLDFDVSGPIIITNDGDLSHKLTHPSYNIEKVYIVDSDGFVDENDAVKMIEGITIENVLCKAKKVFILSRNSNSSRIKVVMTEGRKREVKELCQAVGHKVIKLQRISFAEITADGLNFGEYRKLSNEEISMLKKMVGM